MTTPDPADGRDASKYLLPGEEAIINQRRHWAVLARPTVRSLPVLVIGGWLLTVAPDNRFTSTVGLVLLVGALVYLGLAVGEWWVRHFLVTKRRVLMTSGVIVRTVAVMPLRRITDLTYSESLVGQVLGYGGFRFESAGQDQALSKITYLPNAKVLYDEISGLLFPADTQAAGSGEDPDVGGPDPTARPPAPGSRAAPTRPEAPAVSRAQPVRPQRVSRAPVISTTQGRHPTGPIEGFENPYPHTPH